MYAERYTGCVPGKLNQPLHASFSESHISIQRSEKLRARFMEPCPLFQISLKDSNESGTDWHYPVLTSFSLVNVDGLIRQININHFQTQKLTLSQTRKYEGREDRIVPISLVGVRIGVVVHYLQETQGLLLGQLGRQFLFGFGHFHVISGVRLYVALTDTPAEEYGERFVVSDE